MPSERQARRLEDIRDNITRIERFVVGLDYAGFEADEKVLFAVFHALLIISEAARKLGSEAEALAPDQPWPAIRALGNILRYQYDEVSATAVWAIVQDDLPRLKQSIDAALVRRKGSL